MECLTTAGQLQLFLCAMQWLRLSIPNFEALVQDLHDFLERVYTHIGKRTNRAVSRIPLERFGWQPTHTDAFNSCQKAIVNRTTLANRDE